MKETFRALCAPLIGFCFSNLDARLCCYGTNLTGLRNGSQGKFDGTSHNGVVVEFDGESQVEERPGRRLRAQVMLSGPAPKYHLH